MFTGLVQDVGTVAAVTQGAMTRLTLSTSLEAHAFALGESVACDGVCLTVVARERGHFSVEAAPETLRRTTIGGWRPGRKVNLERALALGDRLGGHMVLGHVDAVGRVVERGHEGGSLVLGFTLPESLAGFFIEKGSVAIDGTSLTVNRLDARHFFVQLIPETQERTTLASRVIGDEVNLEADVIGKYVARLLKVGGPKGGVDEELLKRSGFA
ncbi:MAG: riboflavin synthase [Myxococcales bacterium]